LIGGTAPPATEIPLRSRLVIAIALPQPEPSRWRGRALVSSFILLSKANANQSVIR
jgi:hypothetical protein